MSKNYQKKDFCSNIIVYFSLISIIYFYFFEILFLIIMVGRFFK